MYDIELFIVGETTPPERNDIDLRTLNIACVNTTLAKVAWLPL